VMIYLIQNGGLSLVILVILTIKKMEQLFLFHFRWFVMIKNGGFQLIR
jgi:hypothetical protein